jgi:multidrug resistance efflux pump
MRTGGGFVGSCNFMKKLEKIPLSRAAIVTELRHKLLPVIVFGFAIVLCVVLLNQFTAGGQAMGIGEGLRSIVSSPRVALIKSLHVSPYEWVEEGEPLAVMVPVDPRASLNLLQSELTIARMKMEPSIADRNAVDFERIRIDMLRMEQDLAIAQVNLERAEKVLRRNQELIKEKLVTADVYDFSVNERDMYRADVGNKLRAVEEIRGRLDTLRSLGEPSKLGTNQFMAELLAIAESRLTDAYSNAGPFILKAPISGMVHNVNRQVGEYVTEGEPLMTIVSDKADRIVAYLRQPYGVEPQPGQAVEVSTRSYERKRFQTQVSQVGVQFEMITNALAYMRPGSVVDSGLPVVVRVPPEMAIRPGEVVDLVFHNSRRWPFGLRRDTPSPTPAARAN